MSLAGSKGGAGVAGVLRSLGVVGLLVVWGTAGGHAEAIPVLAEVAELGAVDAEPSDEMGASVAVSGEWIAVGATGDDDAGSQSGAVILYQRTEAGRWRQAEKLIPVDGATGDHFGAAVAMEADRLFVGSPFADEPAEPEGAAASGAVYIYELQPRGSWVQTGKLRPAGSTADFFGTAIAVDGDQLVVGAPGDSEIAPEAGSAFLFTHEPDGEWTETAKLTASDGDLLDQFGTAVAIHSGRVAVGAPLDDDLGPSSGSVYLFEEANPGRWLEIAKRLPSDGANGDLFGETVALDSDWLAVGAALNDAIADFSGSVYVFARDGDTWTESQKLTPIDGAFFDLFGTAVAIATPRLAVGSIGDDSDGTFSGSAYLFELDGDQWVERLELSSASGGAGDEFGTAVALSESHLIVGAVRDDQQGFDSGSASVFERVVVDPEIEVSGSCPGEIRIDIDGVTPRGALELYRADAEGTFRIEEGPCAGTVLGLEAPDLVRAQLAGFRTRYSVRRDVGATDCGRWLQLLDLSTCQVSAARELPPSS